MKLKLSLLLCLISTLALQGCAALFVAGTAATAVVLHDRRDVSTQVEDKGIEFGINNSLSKEEGLVAQGRVRVFSVNSRVLLVGQMPTHALKARVDEVARQQEGVTKVFNEITIGAPIPISQRSQDSWLSTKVRADLVSSEEVDSARTKVVVEDGRVYLMGVLTLDEAAAATEICRNVTGVKEVVRVFDIIN